MKLTRILIATTIMLGIAGAVIPARKAQASRGTAQLVAQECCSDPICLPGDPAPCPQQDPPPPSAH